MIEIDTMDLLEAFVRDGGRVRYRTTRQRGRVEHDEKEPAFELVDVSGTVSGEGLSIEEALTQYARRRLLGAYGGY